MRTAPGAAAKPKRQLLNLILSTDYNADQGDVWDVATAHALHKQGLCRLVSIGCNNKRQFTMASIDQMRKYAGVPSYQIWQYNGAGGASQAALGSREFIHGTAIYDGTYFSGMIPGHIAGLRQVLASCPDQSVIYWNTGQITDMTELLASSADQYSPLTGRQLVSTKILRAYWEAAWCPQNQTPGANNGFGVQSVDPNIVGDKVAAQYLVGSTGGVPNWPTNVPFIWGGEEQAQDVTAGPGTGYAACINPLVSSARVAWGAAGQRAIWAEVCMMVEFYGGLGIYYISNAGGTMTIDASGNNAWTQTPAGPHAYISTINHGAASIAGAQAWFDKVVLPLAAPVTPLPSAHDFSDTIAWWEFTNPAKTSGTGATAQVLDSTGNGYTLGVPAGYTGCTFPTNVLNGYQVGQFSSAMMQFDSLAASFAGAAVDIHVFMLINLTSVTAFQELFDISTGDQTSYAHWQNRLNANQTAGKFAAARATTVATNSYQNGQMLLTAGNWAILELAYATSPPGGLEVTPTAGLGRMLSYINGVGPTVGGFAADNTAFSWTSGRLMGNPTSSDDSTHFYTGGKLAEVAIYNRVLWSQERAARLNYWNQRYALGLSL
jgi:hypothetical protein